MARASLVVSTAPFRDFDRRSRRLLSRSRSDESSRRYTDSDPRHTESTPRCTEGCADRSSGLSRHFEGRSRYSEGRSRHSEGCSRCFEGCCRPSGRRSRQLEGCSRPSGRRSRQLTGGSRFDPSTSRHSRGRGAGEDADDTACGSLSAGHIMVGAALRAPMTEVMGSGIHEGAPIEARPQAGSPRAWNVTRQGEPALVAGFNRVNLLDVAARGFGRGCPSSPRGFRDSLFGPGAPDPRHEFSAPPYSVVTHTPPLHAAKLPSHPRVSALASPARPSPQLVRPASGSDAAAFWATATAAL